ncbi:MAG: class I SAM-dependent methyltransferase [Caldilineaceae bacterium]
MTTRPLRHTVTETLAARTRATWMAGDFGKIAKSYEAGAAAFVARLNLSPSDRVLDVACGTGNLTIPAARGGAQVTGIDIAPNLVEQAQAWARAEGLTVTVDEGNAEQLPYAAASFDLVLTMFGAMFATHPDIVAAELLRVCRSGGRIAMANWTPNSFIGHMLALIAHHAPSTAGVPSPLLWGEPATVTERLAVGAQNYVVLSRPSPLTFPLVPVPVEYFRTYYGPTLRALCHP